jgi:VanZ family protein
MMVRNLLPFWKALLWLVVISLLSLLPVKDIEHVPMFGVPNIDKAVHFTMYGIFSALLLNGFQRFGRKRVTVRKIIYAAGIAIPYGMIMEYFQLVLVTSRHADVVDIMFNIAGCITGISLYALYIRMSIRP